MCLCVFVCDCAMKETRSRKRWKIIQNVGSQTPDMMQVKTNGQFMCCVLCCVVLVLCWCCVGVVLVLCCVVLAYCNFNWKLIGCKSERNGPEKNEKNGQCCGCYVKR